MVRPMLISADVTEGEIEALLGGAEILDFLPVGVTHKRCLHGC